MSDELFDMAQSRRDAEIAKLPIGIEQLKFYIWAVRGLLIGLVLVTLWYARTEYRFSKIDEWIAAEKQIDAGWASKIDKHDSYITSNNIVNLSAQNQLDSIRSRVVVVEAGIAAMQPKLGEVWFLKEHGIDNSTEYYRPKSTPKPAPE